jgi:hypothetical protein
VEQREARRDRTYRAARRAQRAHLEAIHPDGAVDCICERSALYFAKRKGLGGCDCRKRRRGAPKISPGLCYGSGSYRPAVCDRIRWRQERYHLMGGVDPEGFPHAPPGPRDSGVRERVRFW